jgi:signal transduction histidine kinase
MNSIRRRLLAFLLASAVLTAFIVGAFTYRNILGEHEELFDYQLRQMALSLRDQGAIPADLLGTDAQGETPDFVVQIWDFDGARVYLSRPGKPFTNQATLGFSDVMVEGRQWRAYGVASRRRVIQVAQPFDVRRDLAATAALRTLWPLLAFVPFMAALVWWLVGRSLAPLDRLAREVKARDAATLAPVSEAGLPAEIAPVAGALNSLLARLQRSFDRERAFVSDAAHELRSPLTALKLQLQLHGRAADETARAQAIRQLDDGVDRATHLVEQLLALARSEPQDTPTPAEPVDLAEAARLAIADIFALAQARGIHLALEAPEHALVPGDFEALRTLARNLFDNAVRYTPAGGRVRGRIDLDEGRTQFIVEDSGPGIPQADRERVFDRFYRRDTGGGVGSGLGLAIVKGVAARHHAQVSLDPSSLGGLRVRVAFG